jgi:hypothetical protein
MTPTPDERLTLAWTMLHAAHDADVNDETDQTPVPPDVYAEVRAAEQAWMTGKTIATVTPVPMRLGGFMLVMTFTDGTRASFEGNVTSDLCDGCLNALDTEPLMFVREDVDCRVDLGVVA